MKRVMTHVKYLGLSEEARGRHMSLNHPVLQCITNALDVKPALMSMSNPSGTTTRYQFHLNSGDIIYVNLTRTRKYSLRGDYLYGNTVPGVQCYGVGYTNFSVVMPASYAFLVHLEDYFTDIRVKRILGVDKAVENKV